MPKAQQGDVVVVTYVYGCDDARAELLTQLGLEKYRPFDHITQRSLRGPIHAPELADGFSIRPATMDDAEQLGSGERPPRRARPFGRWLRL